MSDIDNTTPHSGRRPGPWDLPPAEAAPEPVRGRQAEPLEAIAAGRPRTLGGGGAASEGSDAADIVTAGGREGELQLWVVSWPAGGGT
jgi:hypothetical protein